MIWKKLESNSFARKLDTKFSSHEILYACTEFYISIIIVLWRILNLWAQSEPEYWHLIKWGNLKSDRRLYLTVRSYDFVKYEQLTYNFSQKNRIPMFLKSVNVITWYGILYCYWNCSVNYFDFRSAASRANERYVRCVAQQKGNYKYHTIKPFWCESIWELLTCNSSPKNWISILKNSLNSSHLVDFSLNIFFWIYEGHFQLCECFSLYESSHRICSPFYVHLK